MVALSVHRVPVCGPRSSLSLVSKISTPHGPIAGVLVLNKPLITSPVARQQLLSLFVLLIGLDHNTASNFVGIKFKGFKGYKAILGYYEPPEVVSPISAADAADSWPYIVATGLRVGSLAHWAPAHSREIGSPIL